MSKRPNITLAQIEIMNAKQPRIRIQNHWYQWGDANMDEVKANLDTLNHVVFGATDSHGNTLVFEIGDITELDLP